jgi:hypothetical protein
MALVRAATVISLAMLLLGAASPSIRNRWVPQLATWYSPILSQSHRSEIVSELSKQPGLHLVIVRYLADHVPANEWVFNSADIDRSRIVWARDMGTEQNLELIRYFKGRGVWTVNPDMVSPTLSAYSPNALADADSPTSRPQ